MFHFIQTIVMDSLTKIRKELKMGFNFIFYTNNTDSNDNIDVINITKNNDYVMTL